MIFNHKADNEPTMTDLSLRFHKDDLLLLSGAQLDQLRRAGRLELPLGSGTPPRSSHALVTCIENDEAESPAHYFSDDSPGGLDYYLHNTWLVRVESQYPTRLLLDAPQTLHKRLSALLPQSPAQAPRFDWEEFESLVDSVGCKMAFSARERVTQTGSFLGQVGICTCGQDGCGSAYAWVEQGMLLALLHTSAMVLNQVYLIS